MMTQTCWNCLFFRCVACAVLIAFHKCQLSQSNVFRVIIWFWPSNETLRLSAILYSSTSHAKIAVMGCIESSGNLSSKLHYFCSWYWHILSFDYLLWCVFLCHIGDQSCMTPAPTMVHCTGLDLFALQLGHWEHLVQGLLFVNSGTKWSPITHG